MTPRSGESDLGFAVDQVTRCRHCKETPVPISGRLCAACQEEVGETSAEQLPAAWGVGVALVLTVLAGLLGWGLGWGP
jgi:cobalamin biosynthesis protein CobD/CbiB